MKGSQFFLKLIGVSFISFCSSCKNTRLDFTQKELSLFGNYSVHDTIYFESNLGDTDTVLILGEHDEREEGGGLLLSSAPYHTKSIQIKHLPRDRWSSTSWNLGSKTKNISYQSLVTVSKSGRSPSDTEYGIRYRTFVSKENMLAQSPHKIELNGKLFPGCFKVSHRFQERVVDSTDIEVVYWTAKYGLTGYSSKSGETWVIRK